MNTCPAPTLEVAKEILPLAVSRGHGGRIRGLAATSRYVLATYFDLQEDTGPTADPGQLVVMSRDPLQVQHRVTVGHQPVSVAVDNVRMRAYVVNYGAESYSLSVVDLTSMQVVQEVALGFVPLDVGVDEQTGRVFVSMGLARQVIVLAGPALDVVARVAVPPIPWRLAVNSVDRRVYVALATASDQIVDSCAIIDADSFAVTFHTTGPSWSHPVDAASDGRVAYVLNIGGAGPPPVHPSVTALNRITGELLWAAPTSFGGSGQVAASPNTRLVAAATGAAVDLVDPTARVVAASVPLGRYPLSVEIDDTTGDILVGDEFDGTVTSLRTVLTSGPLGKRWLEERRILGPARGGELLAANGRFSYQVFRLGTLCHSDGYGTVRVSSPLDAEMLRMLGGAHALGGTNADHLGAPTKDDRQLDGYGGRASAVEFENGVIISRWAGSSAPETTVVTGPIYREYISMGGPEGLLDIPQGPEQTGPMGERVQHFGGGVIVHHPEFGTHALTGQLYAEWSRLRGTEEDPGLPTSSIRPVVLKGREVAFRVRFESCAMFVRKRTNNVSTPPVHRLGLNLLNAYERRFGGPSGPLGLPISSEHQTPTSGGNYADFEGGVLVWHPPGDPLAGDVLDHHTRMFTSAELRVGRIRITGGDEFGSSEKTMHFHHHIGVVGAPVLSAGKKGSWTPAETNLQWRLTLAHTLQGATEFVVMFEGWEEDLFGDNDRAGTINYGLDVAPYNAHLRPAYSVDNLWGFLDENIHRHDAFEVHWTIGELGQPYDPSKTFRGQWWWSFANFDTPTLGWDLYEWTFDDVEEGFVPTLDLRDYADEGWEWLFYQLYSGVAASGNCFGMSLAAIDAAKGKSLLAEPIFSHAWSPDVVFEVNVKHGYQIGAKCVAWVVRQVLAGATQDPAGVFRRSREAHDRGDDPILCLTGYWGDPGHAVLPIGWRDSQIPWEIALADPNYPAASEHESDATTTLLIWPDEGRFEYDGYGTGDRSSDRLYHVPYSVVDRPPDTPGLMLFEELVGGALFTVMGDANVRQVHNQDGRRLFQETAADRRTWAALEPDGATQVPGLSPVPLVGWNATTGSPQLFYSQGHSRRLKFDVQPSADAPTRWGFITPSCAATVTSEGGGSNLELGADALDTTSPTTTVALAHGGTRTRVTMVLENRYRTTQGRQYVVHLGVQSGESVLARLDEGGDRLTLTNSGAALDVKLQFAGTNTKGRSAEVGVVVGASETVRIRPKSWHFGAGERLIVDVQHEAPNSDLRCEQLS